MDLNVLEKEQREQKGQKRSFHCTLASYDYLNLFPYWKGHGSHVALVSLAS